MMDLGIRGLNALVTGASRGLGYATALGLAKEGCRLAINARNPANLANAVSQINNETGAQVIGLPGDITDENTPASIVRDAVSELGGLDLLVTNAGGPQAGSFESFSDDSWQVAIDLSFMSHVRLIRAALPDLRKSRAASVLTITSYSIKQPIPNLVLSNSIRAATAGLTKSLALEYGSDGIRFNSILAGWTETERVIELMTVRAQNNGTSVEEEILKQASQSPFKRMAKPEEFANGAIFLLSPAASYITGVMLTIDGGMYKATY